MNSRDRIAAGLILATTGFAALAIGGAPREAASVSAALAVASAIPYVKSRRSLRRYGPLLTLLTAALAITVFQVLRLPKFLVAFLSPNKLELVEANAKAMGESSPALVALSYDPAATLLEIAKLVSYLALAYSALRVASSARGRLVLATGLSVLGVLVVLVVAAHHALAASALYGFYSPEFASPQYLAPFLNPNHLAGFLALLAPVSLGVAIHFAGTPRLLCGGATVAMCGLSLLAASRAGSIVLALGLLVTAAMVVMQRQESRSRKQERSALIGGAIVVACIVVLVATVAGDSAWQQLMATRSSEIAATQGKFAAWQAAMPLLADHWLTGVGRGGFESAFAAVHSSPARVFSHLENEYLQAGLDWGIPLAALVGVCLVLLTRRIAQRWREGPIAAGVLGGIAAIAVHNTLDFSLSLVGVSMPVIVALAVVARGSLERAEHSRFRLRRSAPIVVGFVVVALAASPLGRSAREEAAMLAESASHGAADLEAARKAWRRHPGDFQAAGYTAAALLRRGDRRAVAVIGRALSLNPRNHDLHVLAARMFLASSFRSQALVEYRLAFRYASKEQLDSLLAELLYRYPDESEAIKGLPEDEIVFPPIMSRLAKSKRTALALAYAQRVTEFYPDYGRAWQEVSRMAKVLGNLELALRAGQQAIALMPDADSAALLAAAQRSAGQPEAAITTIKKALHEGYPTSRTVTEVELLRALAGAELAAGKVDRARETLGKALGLAGTRRARAAAIHHALAALEASQGNPHKARWHREQAATLTGK